MTPREGRPRPDRNGLGGDQVEGLRAVRELLDARRRRVKEIWVSDIADRDNPVVAEIFDLARDARVPVREVSRGRLDAAAGSRAPQGVLAKAAPVGDVDLDDLVRRRRNGPPPFLLVVEGVTDPRNLGALLRSADGAGVTGVVLPRHRAVHLTPAATKAAAGAIEHVAMALVAGVPAAMQALSKAGIWTIGLDGEAARTLYEIDVDLATQPVALVLGSEGSGLSRLTRQRCDVLASLPQRGSLPSLNVGAAGAIACYEVARQRLAVAPD
ncbi:MAG TPA: 23S rRNA (guanosine(2251)-2'-O)-methyltransferase RlmB [Acidimicrobiales bacterium]